jgi:uncharacterized protein (UPF0332 family)
MNIFIRTLNDEGKIKIVEPSDEIANSYIEKSDRSLISAKTLLKIGNYDDAVALTYFSMYNISLALLYKCGIKSENHTGTIILLKDLFEINNSSIIDAKKERVDKQYYVDFKSTDKDVLNGIKIAEEFNSILREKIVKLKKIEINNYFIKAKKLLK